MTQTTILLLFALINILVVGAFAVTILRQYMQRRREAQLYWAIGLGMALLATLAYMLLVTNTPTSETGKFFFRLYYTLGAALTPAWLGLGSIALVTGRRVARTGLLLLCLASLFAVVTISEAPMNLRVLAGIAGSPGVGVLMNGAWKPTIIVLNSLGVLAVVGVALYSGWQLIRRRANVAGFHPGNLLRANMFILAGDLLNAAAGTTASFFGLASAFWLVMALGWVVFFLGALLASRREHPSRQEHGVIQATERVISEI